ncbi:MAG: hypothetical protein ACRDYD_12405 [Acidimicrobiales bacterium]
MARDAYGAAPASSRPAGAAPGARRAQHRRPDTVTLSVLPGGRRKLRIGIGRLLGVLALVSLMSAALTVVVAQGFLAQQQLRLDRLGSQVSSASAHERVLRLEVAQLAAPSRIVSVAEQRLGMVVPSSTTYLAPVPATPAVSSR